MRFRNPEIQNDWTMQLGVSAICITLSVGCANRDAARQNDSQLRAAMMLLGRQYGSYLTEKGGPPPDESTFRTYLQTKLSLLSDLGVTSVDDLLRVGRDGQPFKLIYGTKLPVPERPEYVWVAYEQAGVDGTRLACDSRGGVYEMSATEFSQKLAAK